MIAVRTIYIYIFIYLYSCVHLCEYALYTQLRKLRHSRGLGQLMGVARDTTHALEKKKAATQKLELIAIYYT